MHMYCTLALCYYSRSSLITKIKYVIIHYKCITETQKLREVLQLSSQILKKNNAQAVDWLRSRNGCQLL